MRRTPSGFAHLALTFLALGASGCTESDPGPAAAEAIYVLPATPSAVSDERFFDHPWPSGLRTADGAPVFTGFHNPKGVALVEEYVGLTAGLFDGFSPVAPGYLRFSEALDPASLPATPLAATDPDATVQLVDVDPASPTHGERRLVSVSFRAEGGVYVVPNTLRFMPTLGFPLLPDTAYALVVTRSVRTLGGLPVNPNATLRQALGLDAPETPEAGAAATELAPTVAALAALGLPADRIAHLAVFRTSSPRRELFAVRDDVRANVPAPDFLPNDWSPVDIGPAYDEYRGRYGPSPNYQAGLLPFWHYGDGGQFNFVNGVPAVVDSFDLRFSLTVPKAASCPMPSAGYPIVLFAHGTGGSYTSHLKFADTLAGKCLASMGVDQIFHGDRPGAPATIGDIELLFFNFQNAVAARTNGQQSAIDEVQRARLFTETGAYIPSAVSATGAPIRFDGSRVLFMGHSQGGINGPLYFAADDSCRGGVLSGSGSVIGVALRDKTAPAPGVAGLVKSVLLGLQPPDYGEFDLYHPAIMLVQSIVDELDGANYAAVSIAAPREGFLPKSIYMTEGIGPDGVGDSYAPPKGIEAHAIALGLPLQLPGTHPIEELAWGGPTAVEVPAEGLSGNLANGLATGLFAQFAPVGGSDGHFVVYDVPEAREQAGEFLRRLADDPKGGVAPLQP
ncbi:MAG: hypothetical protein HY908_31545 [Myxococcales bacterium]|nr:hypothetical protein [Myxococcales bacterium]